jgi:excisionase family DNA binding protein
VTFLAPEYHSGDISGLWPMPALICTGAAPPLEMASISIRHHSGGAMQILYSVKEACRQLSVSRSSLYQAFKANRLRPVKYGKRTLIHRDELERFVATLSKH